jgi:hypothetical protein
MSIAHETIHGKCDTNTRVTIRQIPTKPIAYLRKQIAGLEFEPRRSSRVRKSVDRYHIKN